MPKLHGYCPRCWADNITNIVEIEETDGKDPDNKIVTYDCPTHGDIRVCYVGYYGGYDE